ncbi:hypothetical protein NIES4071_11420 [Calothrix sp. NIES-4071]|nr:hypothetical protein NIES4071_11420 [Calothrix sp. NIES-4071]BAZ55482.1 hypothetical protein NIES4105_11380 [Calothrix sp. NIES-4105]
MSQNINKQICKDCIFHILTAGAIECTNPDEFGVNCDKVTFCSSFQPMHEVESPCVAYGEEE